MSQPAAALLPAEAAQRRADSAGGVTSADWDTRLGLLSLAANLSAGS